MDSIRLAPISSLLGWLTVSPRPASSGHTAAGSLLGDKQVGMFLRDLHFGRAGSAVSGHKEREEIGSLGEAAESKEQCLSCLVVLLPEIVLCVRLGKSTEVCCFFVYIDFVDLSVGSRAASGFLLSSMLRAVSCAISTTHFICIFSVGACSSQREPENLSSNFLSGRQVRTFMVERGFALFAVLTSSSGNLRM